METKIERAYAENPDQWEEVDFEEAIDKIGRYFNLPLDTLKASKMLRTPWAFYRIIED